MTETLLRKINIDQIPDTHDDLLDSETMEKARKIVLDIKTGGESALIEHAKKFGDLKEGDPLVLGKDDFEKAMHSLDQKKIDLMTRTAARIEKFARFQLGCIKEGSLDIENGTAGQTIAPLERAGCYAPGGRYPLPSSVLMTAITARVAGVKQIWVASPKPAPETLAAAAIAGADYMLCAGGAHAVAALGYGAGPVPPCDIVVGPGNRWVTAAKKLIAGQVRIDMLAGPSELLVLADATAPAGWVAADLLAQAEHDPDAVPILVSFSPELIETVEKEISTQLKKLPSADIARRALANGFAVVAPDLDSAIKICDRFAPEHLEIMTARPDDIAKKLSHYGALFIGPQSAEVLGDYGAGPNHVLPTGKASRITGGLSVFDFLRVRTWMRMDDPESGTELIDDAEKFAVMEGLAGHAFAAHIRKKNS